jgi:hypothetical protein
MGLLFFGRPKQEKVLHAKNFFREGGTHDEVRGASTNREIFKVSADTTKNIREI